MGLNDNGFEFVLVSVGDNFSRGVKLVCNKYLYNVNFSKVSCNTNSRCLAFNVAVP